MKVMRFWIGLAVAVCGLQASSPSSILDKEVQSWIIKDFERIRSNKNPIKMSFNINGQIANENKKVETVVDYIQLLASDLALGKFNNKEMLIKGFLLMAIIQGEVWPVDYMNPAGSAKAGKTGDTKKLLLNASKIAAYAMTYRMGASKDGGAPVADGAGYKKDGTKEEYEYNGGPALNRQGAITKLGSTTNKLQSNALVDAWFILSHAHKSTPSNPAKGTIKADAEIYGKMYTGTTKNTSVQKIALQGWPQGIAGENAMLFKLDIDGQTALSPMRHR